MVGVQDAFLARKDEQHQRYLSWAGEYRTMSAITTVLLEEEVGILWGIPEA